jgi:uncharacterized DUF497 family protein
MAERGLPFDVAMALFDGPTLELPDLGKNYGEDRIKAIGVVMSVVLVCVYTDRFYRDRPDARRIISLRLANRREQNDYRAAFEI